MIYETRTCMVGTVREVFDRPVAVFDDGKWYRFSSGEIDIRMQMFESDTLEHAALAVRAVADSAPGTSGVLYIRQPWTTNEIGRTWGRFGFVVFT